jgi:signal transduction histidine kinase
MKVKNNGPVRKGSRCFKNVAKKTLPVPLRNSIKLVGKAAGKASRAGICTADRMVDILASFKKKQAKNQRCPKLIAEVAHQLRNPLQGVLGYLELTRAQVGENPKAVEWLEAAREELERMDNMLERILNMSRGGEEPRLKIEVAPLLEDALSLVRPRIMKSGIKLEYEIEPGLPKILVQPAKLAEALLNLLNNAVDACAEGNTIRLEARLSEGGRTLDLAVTNDGPEVPGEIRERIFEPFFSTKAPGCGTGLGLFLAKQSVLNQGGRLVLDAAFKQGVSFHIYLPVPSRA